MENDKIYDMIEELLTIDLRHMDEEEKRETEYLINDIVISLEELAAKLGKDSDVSYRRHKKKNKECINIKQSLLGL